MARPPLCDVSPAQRKELLALLAEADVLEDLPGKWRGAIAAAESTRSDGGHPPHSPRSE